MNEHDKELVEKAWRVSPYDWSSIDENEAETEEGKRKLHDIMTYKYHMEEALCDCI